MSVINKNLVDCPACKGVGKIDMTIHIVDPGQSNTLCKQPRPMSDRRRTTNPQRASCEECLAVVRRAEIKTTNENNQ